MTSSVPNSGLLTSGLNLSKSGSLCLFPVHASEITSLANITYSLPGWSLSFSDRGWFCLSFSNLCKPPWSGDFHFTPFVVYMAHPFLESLHSGTSIYNHWSLCYNLTFCVTVKMDRWKEILKQMDSEALSKKIFPNQIAREKPIFILISIFLHLI